MSESINVQHAFDPELRQAQADMDQYVKTRAFEDTNGQLHDPNGQFTSEAKQANEFEAAREAHFEATTKSYDEMSLSELADKWADAESHEDKTTVDDVMDAVLTKIQDQYGKEDKVDSEYESTQDKMLDRVLKLKDMKLAEKTSTKSSDSANPESDTKTSDTESDDVQEAQKELSPEELTDQLAEVKALYATAREANNKQASDELVDKAAHIFEEIARRAGWEGQELVNERNSFFDFLNGKNGESSEAQPEEEFDFSTDWDSGDQFEDGMDEVANEKSGLISRFKKRINSVKTRVAMVTVGDFRGALAGDPEKTRRISRKLLIGASAVALAGVAAVFIKRGDIDLLPSKGRFGDGDGVGIDLFGRKLGSGTNHAPALWQDNPLAGKPGVNVGTTSAPEAVTQAWVDQVKPGDGITNSIMDYASQHGKPISAERAFEVFNKLKPSITGNSITGSTPMNVIGDIGYAAPGQSTWSPEMIERMNELLGL